jgi:nuclear pore complex protein Nup54
MGAKLEKFYNKFNHESRDCAFQYYFYNFVGENAQFYQPTQRDDEAKWEKALDNKPGPGYTPVLAVGFQELGRRLEQQAKQAAALNVRLHEINDECHQMLQTHDLVISLKALEARRRHTQLSHRVLKLATKVQVLRSRGYALGPEEEDLKLRLANLEKATFDPALSGRAEEIWARMVGVRERARMLQEEMKNIGRRAASGEGPSISPEMMKKAEKVS